MRRLLFILLLLAASLTHAEGCHHVIVYTRNFVVVGNSTLPNLRILSISPVAQTGDIIKAELTNNQTLRLIAYPEIVCDIEDLSASGNGKRVPKKGNIEITMRVGTDDGHYINLMLYINNKFNYQIIGTSVNLIGSPQYGVTYIDKPIAQNNYSTVTLNFTK